MKRVALIGSSGGGTATLGHTDPVAFLRAVDHQLTLVEGHARLVAALFVALDGGKGMDGANDRSPARLFQLQETKDDDFRYEVIALGTLAEINVKCEERQQSLIAKAIREKRIDGLICVSCHVRIFRETLLEAAARDEFPVTGSGGTSLAQVAIFGIKLAGNAGGSVATTSSTKAVSYAHALATAWDKSYQPWKRNSAQASNSPSWTSVLNSSLPAFWGVCLTKKILLALNFYILQGENNGGGEDLFSIALEIITQTIAALEHHTLPTACAVLMASSLRNKEALSSESSVVMAAILASSSCYDSVLAGLWAGYLVAVWSDRCLYASIFWNFPATLTSLICGGGLGGGLSLVVLPIAEILRQFTSFYRYTLSIAIASRPWGVWLAFFLGCVSCYGSKVGYYHSVHLPLILIEMELGNASFLGVVDELTLVIVCAGVCAAVQMPARPKDVSSQSDLFLCRRGLSVNLCCGDFVEVCYPYMEKSLLVNVGGYLASGISCAWLVWRSNSGIQAPESMAYLPWPAALALASMNWRVMLESSVVAFVIAFLFTCARRK